MVVGIDGSEAAVTAALWAVDEAVDRDVPLRLVYATGATSQPCQAPYFVTDVAVEYGETCLRAASSMVAATGKTVKTETDILWGEVESRLIAESRSAAMLCVGSVGIDWFAGRVLGSTATAMTENAECPVVVVRYPRKVHTRKHTPWVVVSVDDRDGTDELMGVAVDEARLRGAAVLAVATWGCLRSDRSSADLDRRVQRWRDAHEDLHIHQVATASGLPEFLVMNKAHFVELVVLPADDADQVRAIIGSHCQPLVPYGECSVMVVR
ncbi:universal stress protein [Mycolicibacterium agri]|uniref:Universal stress protein n=1 Tax=Mycolicibacterium agri TaxID=36811 RepID=A0A7I9VY15_MYCAG|nr:universal stress protein [Mycolicibacterium agri]